MIKLPKPVYDGAMSLEAALRARRSVRSYTAESLTLAEVSQLLWAAQGVTGQNGMRTAPSAGALYPLEAHLVAGGVDTLAPGVYRYCPAGHELIKTIDGDKRLELSAAALGQGCIGAAAVDIVLAGVRERTAVKYGGRAKRYIHFEAGHAAQNVCLQATALNLGTVMVGAFDDRQVQKALHLDEDEYPLYIMPVGRTGVSAAET